MRQIIKGKKYDTDTAKKLIDNTEGDGPGDFSYLKESLYQKKTGEFFLAGSGHANTQYASIFRDNSRGMGDGIFPLELNEAKEWVEEKANWLYEEIFGTVEE